MTTNSNDDFDARYAALQNEIAIKLVLIFLLCGGGVLLIAILTTFVRALSIVI